VRLARQRVVCAANGQLLRHLPDRRAAARRPVASPVALLQLKIDAEGSLA
jgi:hypothetical protein